MYIDLDMFKIRYKKYGSNPNLVIDDRRIIEEVILSSNYTPNDKREIFNFLLDEGADIRFIRKDWKRTSFLQLLSEYNIYILRDLLKRKKVTKKRFRLY